MELTLIPLISFNSTGISYIGTQLTLDNVKDDWLDDLVKSAKPYVGKIVFSNDDAEVAYWDDELYNLTWISALKYCQIWFDNSISNGSRWNTAISRFIMELDETTPIILYWRK